MTIVLYNLFLWLYQLGIRMVSPWNPKAAAWISGRKGLFKTIREADIGSGKRVWMHCASLGEFEQGRPVIESIRRIYPGVSIIISFFSPSGYNVRKDYSGADQVFYLPMDSDVNAKKYLDIINPSLVLWVKYDYWYYYLSELRKRNIPVLLISPVFRPDQPFFKWYGNIHRLMLDSFHAFFVQNEQSKELLKSLNINQPIVVSGDSRFDRVIDIANGFETIPLIENYCGDHIVVVAGSTWEEDEEELDHYARIHPEMRFIIAPHEIDEERLLEVEALFTNSIRYSVLEKKVLENFQSTEGKIPNPNVLIIDNMGMLARLYNYAKICYVGGGFGDDGVHNVLEAAVYGKPVVTGPEIEKFVEATELSDCGGLIIIDNALEAESVFERLKSDEKEYQLHADAARAYVLARGGATGKIMEYIQENRLLTN